jgi:hypothetical protein
MAAIPASTEKSTLFTYIEREEQQQNMKRMSDYTEQIGEHTKHTVPAVVKSHSCSMQGGKPSQQFLVEAAIC